MTVKKNTIDTLDNTVHIHKEHVSNTSFGCYPDVYYPIKGKSKSIIEAFKSNFSIKISHIKELELEFDLIGIDPSFANALRRLLIAEVPTIAIEKVYMMFNTSVVPDEILSHRLGLIPIKADPRKLEFKKSGEGSSNRNTLVFNLKVKCDSKHPEKCINVYSKDLIWIPQADQEEWFKDESVKPVQDDILVAKLAPGQEIDLEVHCEKNIGKEHAKWSPVATATYRLLPKITIKEPIMDADAKKFASCFPEGVISLETKIKDNEKHVLAVVNNPRNDTMSRECKRYKEFADKVELGRVKDHYIFSVESVGILPPQILVEEALDILILKCSLFEKIVDQIDS